MIAQSRIGDARSELRQACAQHAITDERCHDAQLALTELLSNAFRHGAPPVTYEATVTADGIRLVVQDAGQMPTRRSASTDEPAGDLQGSRGLFLVAKVSQDHGWESVAQGGKRFWAVI